MRATTISSELAVVIGCLMIGSFVACAPIGANVDEQLILPSLVIVQNDAIEDLAIYLSYSGMRIRRLGVAHRSRTDTLFVREQDLTGLSSIAIDAVEPISGVVRASNAAPVRSGAQYRLHIGSGGGEPLLFVRAPRP